MKLFFSLAIILSSLVLTARTPVDSTGTQEIAGKKFIKHQVEKSEGWMAIARRYGISYAELRMANKDSSDKLRIGQIVLIPARAKVNDPRFQKNYPAQVKTVPAVKPETISPPVGGKRSRIHVVEVKETMYSISKQFKVGIPDIQSWNNIKDFSIHIGQKLIVGYEGSPEVEKTKPVIKKEPVETVRKAEPEKEKVVEQPVKRSPPKGEAAPVVYNPESPAAKAESKGGSNYAFNSGRKEIIETGMATWIEDDEANKDKFIAIHRTAPVGTIIKVTNNESSQAVFVKVIGVLQDNPDNDGLILKVSKATADKLKVTDKIFRIEMIYGVSEK